MFFDRIKGVKDLQVPGYKYLGKYACRTLLWVPFESSFVLGVGFGNKAKGWIPLDTKGAMALRDALNEWLDKHTQ